MQHFFMAHRKIWLCVASVLVYLVLLISASNARSEASFNVAGEKANPSQASVAAPVVLNIVGINAIKYKAQLVVSQTVTEVTVPSTAIAPVFGSTAKVQATSTKHPEPATKIEILKKELDDTDIALQAYGMLADSADVILATDASENAVQTLLDRSTKVLNDLPDTSKFTFRDDAGVSALLDTDTSPLAMQLKKRIDERSIEARISEINAIKKHFGEFTKQGQSAFRMTEDFSCGFSQTSNKVSIKETPVVDDPRIKGRTLDITSADCSSPIRFSTGPGVSFIPVTTVGFVSSSPSVQPTPIPTVPPPGFVNRFENTEQSSHQIVVPLLVHARIIEGPAGGLYLTAGGVAGGSGGYLFGASYSLGNAAFLTVADHFGSTTKLSGGYNINDIVPPNLASVPTTKSNTSGLFLSLTFPIAAPAGK